MSIHTPSEFASRQRRQDNLRRMFSPRSIVVVGASSDPAKAGSQALSSLRAFADQVMAVHPRETAIQERPCFASIGELPEGIDLAVLAIPATSCVTAVEELAQRNVGGVFIISGGFGEASANGADLEQELLAVSARTGIRILGPNTSGFVAPHVPLIASFVPGVEQLAAGRVAVIAQSGGVNLSLAFLLEHLNEGISLAVGLGNAIDVSSVDILELLATDPHTCAIALHLEGVPDGRRLYEALREVTPLKPVVALVAGKSDIGAFAVSHTGKLLGSRQRTVAALRQAGAVVVDTTQQLAQAAATLSYTRLPPKPAVNVALITGQAGPGLLIADELKSSGVNLPEVSATTLQNLEALLPPMTYVSNPIDTGRPGPTFPRVVEAVAADPAIDAVLVFGLDEPAVLDPATALRDAKAVGKPLLFGTLGAQASLIKPLAALRAGNILGMIGPEPLAQAMVAIADDAKAQHLLAEGPKHAQPAPALLSGDLDEIGAKALLATYGIAVPRNAICASRNAAIEAFRALRKPVVVKILATDIAHKTEVGGVIVGVSDETALLAALDRIAAIRTNDPGRVLIEEMAQPGIELIVGGVRDPSWGPIVMVGLGGILSEVLADTAPRLAPVSGRQAADMLDCLRGEAILEGFRGMPPVDRRAITDAICAVSRLMVEHPEVTEVEINPLRVFEHGALALDALVRIDNDTLGQLTTKS